MLLKKSNTPLLIPHFDCKITFFRAVLFIYIASAKRYSHKPSPYTYAWSKKFALASSAVWTNVSAYAAFKVFIRMQSTAITSTGRSDSPCLIILIIAPPVNSWSDIGLKVLMN